MSIPDEITSLKREIARLQAELEILENHTHLSSEVWDILVLDSCKFISADGTGAFLQLAFCDHCPDDGGLSRADLSDDINEISRVHIHVESVYDGGFSIDDVCVVE